MELEERLDDMITEIMNDLYNDTRDTNAEFEAQIKKMDELSAVEMELQKILSENDYEKHEELVGLRQEISMQMQKEAYIRGAKDCVAILRKIGVIA